MGTLHEDVFTFMTVSCWIILKMSNVSNKTRRENQNTHCMSFNLFSENRTVFEIMSKNTVDPGRPEMTIWRRVACWLSKATRSQAHAHAPAPTSSHALAHTRALVTHIHTHTYVLLTAFPWQQWFRKRSSILRYTYMTSIVFHKFLELSYPSTFLAKTF
jgi:hypothetical protein